MKSVIPARKGAALVEYCVLMGLIAVVAIGSVGRLGNEIGGSFEDISAEMSGSLSVAFARARGEGGDQGSVQGDSSFTSVYDSACSSGRTSMEVEGDVVGDANNDGEYTFGFRRFTQPWTSTLQFDSVGEQEYYGSFQGVDAFDRYQYGQTTIYPPNWNPCIDDQGYPPPSLPPEPA